MSTRAVYTFKDKRDTYHIYKHHDGYPSGGCQAIINGLMQYNEEGLNTTNFEACELGARFIVGNKNRYGGVYLTHHYDNHGDLEYRYEVESWHEGAHIRCFAETGEKGFDQWKMIFTGNIKEFQEWTLKSHPKE